MSTYTEIMHRELEALRRGRDQAATQMQTAINALDAGLLTLTDVEARIATLSTAVTQLEQTKPTIDVRPGHYISMGKNDSQDDMAGALQPGVQGLQVRYPWAMLEPAENVYDFSRVIDDLRLLDTFGNRLVVFIEDKSFDGTRPTPTYISDQTLVNRNGGYTVARWNWYVRDRFQRLLTILGMAIDGHPGLEGIAIQESSLSLDDGVLDAHGYTPELYRDALIDTLTAARESFPTSQVFWYMNFLRGNQGYIGDIAREAVRLHVAMGGPDVLPEEESLQKHVYPYYEQFAEEMTLFNSIQHNSYAHKKPSGEYWTMQGLFDYARDVLHVDYLFWNRKTWKKPSDSFDWMDALPVIEKYAEF